MSADNSIKFEHEETNKISTNSPDNSEQENSGDSSDTSCIPNTTNSGKEWFKKKDLASLQFGKKLKNVLFSYIIVLYKLRTFISVAYKMRLIINHVNFV